MTFSICLCLAAAALFGLLWFCIREWCVWINGERRIAQEERERRDRNEDEGNWWEE